jgi:NADPH:quinone reductase-like Zn-dependent oxidoreductase
MRLTANRGVDVVLNSLAGEMLVESWECLAPLGTFIEIGKADIYKRSHLSMVPFDKNVTFASIDLLVLFDERPKAMYHILGKVLDMLEQGVVTPVYPFQVFGIHQIELAFRLIAERKHTGKVILEVGENAVVTAELPPPADLELDANGTYIIAGGLGDLGRRLCALLARRGAGRIVTLSRRVLEETVENEFVKSIAELGANLYLARCDVVDKAAVEKVKDMIESHGLSPVRGIIHGGMVLRVSSQGFNMA